MRMGNVTRRKWTPQDQAIAEVAAACGVSFRQIGRALGRTDNTIRYRLLPHPVVACKSRYRLNAERHVWHQMIHRCTNPRSGKWPRYGGRGICVCDRWRNSFDAFLADVGHRPSSRHQLDRIDNDGHYQPGNVRWATPKQQSRNKSNNRIVAYGGESIPITEALERAEISRFCYYSRLSRGWSAEEALSIPVGQRRQKSRDRRSSVL